MRNEKSSKKLIRPPTCIVCLFLEKNLIETENFFGEIVLLHWRGTQRIFTELNEFIKLIKLMSKLRCSLNNSQTINSRQSLILFDKESYSLSIH